jgi:hypothetical protein
MKLLSDRHKPILFIYFSLDTPPKSDKIALVSDNPRRGGRVKRTPQGKIQHLTYPPWVLFLIAFF